MRRVVRLIAVAAVLSPLARPAMAFDERTQGGGSGPPAAAMPNLKAPGLDLSLPSDLGSGKGAGTEVRIPGIGTLGVLPKLDFGLELLYGANATEPRGVPDNRVDPSDIQLRATIKHRF